MVSGGASVLASRIFPQPDGSRVRSPHRFWHLSDEFWLFPGPMLRKFFANGISLARQPRRVPRSLFELFRIPRSALRVGRLALLLAVIFLLLSMFQLFSAAATVNITVHSEPLHAGRITPKLFGNFVELLDDVVPGLWAEMLNDRAFAGVTPCLNPFYYDGAPNFCDRQWDTNSSWKVDPLALRAGSSRDAENSFH